MKKLPFSQVFRRKNVSAKASRISLLTEHSRSQHIFIAGFRCPSDQFQFIAIPLAFVADRFCPRDR